jgi:diguanylate cyclase (GGDEF)-like protein
VDGRSLDRRPVDGRALDRDELALVDTSPPSARLATSLLAVVLAGAGLVAALAVPEGRVLRIEPTAPQVVLLGGLVAVFALAEIALVHVELRRQAYSFSLSGIPLLIGVLFLDVRLLILARVLGAVSVLVWQRLPPLKVAYNAAAYLLETSLVGVVLHGVLGSGIQLTLSAAIVCYLVIAVVDVLMSALVLLVIYWHQGRVDRLQVSDIFLPAALLGAACTTLALGVATLLDDGPLGLALIFGFAVAIALVYHSYLAFGRRLKSLGLMHDFIAQGVGAATVEELAEAMLSRTRTLLNAGRVELTLYRDGTDEHLRITEDDAFSTRAEVPAGTGDWLLTRVAVNAEPIVIARNTRDRGMRQWLIANHARDAMVVPLVGGSIGGVLVVKDRLGEASTFKAGDLALLQTLAGHIVLALRGTQLVQQLRREATHDALTGLANRARLTELIDAAAALDGGSGTPAVLLLDLDKFKEVNDALGHPVGDALLRVVGARLGNCVPVTATVARLGGDEFAILLPSTRAAEAEARLVADAVMAALSTPIALSEAVISTRASIGIALLADGSPNSADGSANSQLSSADLLRHADTAMYAAKGGEHPVVVYTAELDHGRAERLSLLSDLHLALERDELELHYQPQIDLRTNQMVSVEALARWRHPQLGLLAPDAFIPLAESSGLIEGLTRQVLRKALRQCREWRDEGIDLVVAVNLSAANINANLADDVAAALAEADVPADRLILEITESSVMGDPRRTVPILQALAELGVALSLDDFGTGYSSLAYLQRLPVSEIKIDKSFVAGMASSTQAEAEASQVLVRSILTLGGGLGLRVVAEGVEDAEGLEMLRDLGCDLAQGYHLGRPQTAAAITTRMVGVAGRRPTRLSVVAG